MAFNTEIAKPRAEETLFTAGVYRSSKHSPINSLFIISDSSTIDPSIPLELYRHKNTTRRLNDWRVTGQNPFIKYEGYSSRNISPSFVTKYLLGIIDQVSKEIYWVETNQIFLSRMPSSIKQIETLKLPVAPIINADNEDKKRIANSLGETFGTKRRRQAIKAKEGNAIQPEMISTKDNVIPNSSLDKKVKKRNTSVAKTQL